MFTKHFTWYQNPLTVANGEEATQDFKSSNERRATGIGTDSKRSPHIIQND